MVVVDIHCHTFNAKDVPVGGFLRRIAFGGHPLGDALADLLDRWFQGRAPSYAQDAKRVDRLLGAAAAARRRIVRPAQAIEAAKRDAADMLDTHPVLYARVNAAMQDRFGPSGPVDPRQYAKQLDIELVARAIAWVKLFCSSRIDIAERLLLTYPTVDLVTPLLVDLDCGLEDPSPTTVAQQVDLGEKISRASMLRKLSRGIGPHIHPFVSFDPLRQLAHQKASRPGPSPRDEVERAILEKGFIGVKVYPPMGWRPSGNVPRLGLSEQDARALDAIVLALTRWCADNDVPVTAHANNSLGAGDDFGSFASPAGWLPLVQQSPTLRLDLGHFGGSSPDPGGWPWQIARAIGTENSVYTDIGNHSPENRTVTDKYLALLAQMFDQPNGDTVKQRLMYGTDWFMLAIKPRHEKYLDDYESLFKQHFGQAITDSFLGNNALSFLGFSDRANKNTQRLVKRYQTYDCPIPEWLAT
jgi:predicted TIM-barrel fold metal-dependent hydrolase